MIQRAFLKAASGKECLICKKQIPHAFYQRHFDICKLNTTNDDDIVLVKEIVSENVISIDKDDDNNKKSNQFFKTHKDLTNTNIEYLTSTSSLNKKEIKLNEETNFENTSKSQTGKLLISNNIFYYYKNLNIK